MLKVIPMRRPRRVVDEDGNPFRRAPLRNGNVVAARNQYKVRVAMGVGEYFVRLPVRHSVRDDYSVAGIGKSHAAIKLSRRKVQTRGTAHAPTRGVLVSSLPRHIMSTLSGRIGTTLADGLAAASDFELPCNRSITTHS